MSLVARLAVLARPARFSLVACLAVLARLARRSLLVWLAALGVLGCEVRAAGAPPDPRPPAALVAPRAPASARGGQADVADGAAAIAAEQERDRQCRERIERLRALPVTPTSGGLTPPARARLLAEVKATPVLFVEKPVWTAHDAIVAGLRRELERSEVPGRPLSRLLTRNRHFHAFLRSVLLTEGYLYAETPALGTALGEALALTDLFKEPDIVIERGGLRLAARRGEDGRYAYVDGPEKGLPARMLLWDRLWVAGAEPGPPRHVDVEALAGAVGFDALEIERVTPEGMIALARYGDVLVPSVLERTGTEVSLSCELVQGDARKVEVSRARARRMRPVLDALRAVITDQVAEALPFDEPKTEFGQEDGKLRQEWRLAYEDGRTRYHYNGDVYPVFDRDGRARVPQVCIDFVFDTLERLGGSWYGRADAPRARTKGRIDVNAFAMENPRNVEEFLALAERRADLFELRTVPPEERVALERRERFFSTLFERRAEYRPGDIVVILGLRDDEKFHYHSFFVVDADPITGMPTLVAGNSGRPRVRAFAVEMAPAPKRSLFARVRPRLEWLEGVVQR